MVDPKTPPRHDLTNEGDAGFPPLRDIADLGDNEGDTADDPEADFHEDGGGD